MKLRHILTGLFLAGALCLNAQISPAEAIQQMGRGINMGNTLDAPYEGAWAMKAQEWYFQAYKDAGFSTVRIPVTWDSRVEKTSPWTVDPDFLDHVEEIMDWALDRDLFVIINAHHEGWLKDDFSADNQARFDSIWSQVSRRFQNKPEKLFFEMINEPHGLTRSQVDSLNARVLSIIRRNNPTRIVLYSGNGWSSSSDMMAAAIPEDPYIMAYFHSYDPWNFAGEGNGTWGTASERAGIMNSFAQIAEWSDDVGVEILLGEGGAHEDCDYTSRMIHYATYVEASLVNKIAYTVWDDDGWFGVLNRRDSLWRDSKDILIHFTPQSPDNLKADNYNDSSYQLTWTLRSEDYDTIYVERRYDEIGFKRVGGVSGDSSSWVDSVSYEGVNHYYRVIAVIDTVEHYSYSIHRYKLPYHREPYHGTPANIPGTIEAEDYDIGGELLTYHDTEAENRGGAYRLEEGVDIETRDSGGYHVGYVAPGEWIEYTVNVEREAEYMLTVPVASMEGGGTFLLRMLHTGSGALIAPMTESWQTTSNVNKRMSLRAGEQVMKVFITGEPAFNLDKFIFTEVTSLEEVETTGFSLWPNPAREVLYIRLEEEVQQGMLRIYRPDGRLVKALPFEGRERQIRTEGLGEGLYFFRIEGSTGIMSGRFLVQK